VSLPVAYRSRTVANCRVQVIFAFTSSSVSQFCNEILRQRVIMKNTNIFRTVHGRPRYYGHKRKAEAVLAHPIKPVWCVETGLHTFVAPKSDGAEWSVLLSGGFLPRCK